MSAESFDQRGNDSDHARRQFASGHGVGRLYVPASGLDHHVTFDISVRLIVIRVFFARSLGLDEWWVSESWCEGGGGGEP